MRSYKFIYRLLVFSSFLIFHVLLLSGQNHFPTGNASGVKIASAFHKYSNEPLPPDSVYAQVLGSDSAMYISWQAPPDSGLVLESYEIYRLSDFDPEGDPATGVQTWFLSQNWPACSDPSWPQLEAGWYAYGVKAVYTNGMMSEMAVSNVVGHNMYCSVTVHVSLENNDTASDARVFLYGKDYSYQNYSGRDSVNVTIDSVMKGHYLLAAYQTGFDSGYIANIPIYNDTLIEIQLVIKKYQIFDLRVDSVSLIANWSQPSMIAVWEDFEGEEFPPRGWQLSAADSYGDWFRTLDGSSGGFFIPPGDGHYACDNVDMHGTDPHNSCCDYLITPPLDLTVSPDYMLDFESYYTGAYGQLAFVEFSYDRGETWEELFQLTPSNIWTQISILLSAFSGEDKENPIWIAFHADWGGGWASGWAVDNIKIHVPSSTIEFTDYNVYLDDSLKSVTSNNSYNYSPLNYGQSYIASVSVNYPYGTSKKDYYRFTSRYLPPPCNLLGTSTQSEVTLHWEPPVEVTYANARDSLLLPENILGYNIYRDNIFMDYKAHTGGYELQVYIDSNLVPGHYTYDVSGVYDLTIYGFPGDTGESMRSGTVAVTVDYCNELPFSEHWDSGNFTQNGWILDDPGWDIDYGNGNPMPCAVFSPDTVLENYSSVLVSYPFCGDSLSEGDIWIDYDISLLSNQPTGLETLQVEIWNWSSQSWTTKKEYSNLNGNIAWTSEHININPQSLKKIFKIRFLAKGVNSGDIEKWYLDNISIYRECGSPTDLASEAVAEQSAIILNWKPPQTYWIDQWIHWDDGVFNNSIGTGGATEFDVAARWEPDQLADLEGASVKEIAFYPVETNCTYSIRIWTGIGPVLAVDQLVYNPTINQWNYIELNNPLLINTTEELWVGYNVNTQTGYPAGFDHGPAVDGFGNMMNYGGWQTLLEINPDMNYNWNIMAHVITLEGERISLTKGGEVESENGNPRDISGYNIYRRTDAGDYQLIGFTADTTYTDVGLANALYCYKVSSVWTGESDQCESDLTGEVCEIMNVGIPGTEASDPAFNLYPNPANDQTHITATSDLEHITVYYPNGQLVLDEAINGHQHILRTSTFNNGIYLVRVKTAAGIVTRVLTIQR
jgi:hypothetical protein